MHAFVLVRMCVRVCAYACVCMCARMRACVVLDRRWCKINS
jgi:hypothetical protein